MSDAEIEDHDYEGEGEEEESATDLVVGVPLTKGNILAIAYVYYVIQLRYLCQSSESIRKSWKRKRVCLCQVQWLAARTE